MNNQTDLTQGSIFNALIKLAIPIMATSFFQMAYNMTDMMWLGRVGSSAVAAVGTAGFFLWFGFSIIMLTRAGAEMGVSQSFGKKDWVAVRGYMTNSLLLNVLTAITYGIFLFIFANHLIGFFRLGDPEVVKMAVTYLRISAVGIVFLFINPIFSSIYNGLGDSKIPFKVNSIGLVINIILDPILIFGVIGFPKLGAAGAAIASIFAQFVVSIIFILLFIKKEMSNKNIEFSFKPQWYYIKSIIKVGSPVSLQFASFATFSILLGRIIAQWGAIPIAVQKIGIHVEAISWATAAGFSAAVAAFVGQNFGAQKWERIPKGFFIGIASISVVGILTSLALIIFAKPIFSIFIPEEEAIRYGEIYLRILGLSQLFLCWEITCEGAFRGLGRTIPASIISVFFTGMRVPMAWFLSRESLLGLNGIWWSVSMSTVFKGTILIVGFMIILQTYPEIRDSDFMQKYNPFRKLFYRKNRNLAIKKL